jgi:hypothetical protein
VSTWYFIENVEVPPGTKFPCDLSLEPTAIEDEQRFLDLLASFPGFELRPNGPPDAEQWMLESGGQDVGELSLSRRPGPQGFLNPFDLMRRGLGLEEIWKLKRQGALDGLSIRAHPGLALSLYEHLKSGFPGLILLEEDSSLLHNGATFRKAMRKRGWEI